MRDTVILATGETMVENLGWLEILKYIADAEAQYGAWGEQILPEYVNQDESELIENLNQMQKAELIEGAGEGDNVLQLEWDMTKWGYLYLYMFTEHE